MGKRTVRRRNTPVAPESKPKPQTALEEITTTPAVPSDPKQGTGGGSTEAVQEFEIQQQALGGGTGGSEQELGIQHDQQAATEQQTNPLVDLINDPNKTVSTGDDQQQQTATEELLAGGQTKTAGGATGTMAAGAGGETTTAAGDPGDPLSSLQPREQMMLDKYPFYDAPEGLNPIQLEQWNTAMQNIVNHVNEAGEKGRDPNTGGFGQEDFLDSEYIEQQYEVMRGIMNVWGPTLGDGGGGTPPPETGVREDSQAFRENTATMRGQGGKETQGTQTGTPGADTGNAKTSQGTISPDNAVPPKTEAEDTPSVTLEDTPPVPESVDDAVAQGQAAIDGGVDETGSPEGWNPDTYASLGENGKAFADQNPDPSQYPGGILQWNKDFDAAVAQDGGPPGGETGGTGGEGDGEAGADTSIGGFNDFMGSVTDMASSLEPGQSPEDIGQNENVNNFIDSIINADPELSAEEEASIRRSVEQATQRALSAMSGRGMGRGSEAARMILQGEIMAEFEVGRRKNELRQQTIDNAMAAAGIETSRESRRADSFFKYEGMEIDRAVANRNFYLATQEQRLDEVKNAQGHSLAQAAQELAEDYFGLAEDEQAQKIREFEASFGLALNREQFEQAMRTGEFNLDVLDSDRTYDLNVQGQLNEYLLTARDQDIQENLGISRLEYDKWLAGEEIKLETVANAIHHLSVEYGHEIGLAQIEAQLAEIQAMGETSWLDFAQELGPQLGTIAFLL